MTTGEAEVRNGIVSIVEYFLKIRKALDCTEILKSVKNLEANINIKVHFLHSHLFFIQSHNLVDYSEEHREGFD